MLERFLTALQIVLTLNILYCIYRSYTAKTDKEVIKWLTWEVYALFAKVLIYTL